MKKTINMQHEANIQAEGKLSGRSCKPVICLETGEVFSSMTDAAENIGASIQHMSNHLTGRYRSIHGKHYCYVSRVTESLDTILTRLRETAAIEEDAKKWKAYKAEQETKRIAEQKRQDAINKAKEKVARCDEICNVLAEKYNDAMNNLRRAQMELEALENEEV